MKIRYLQEGYIKTVDKMKDNLGKKHTADDIRKEAKKILVEEILENEEFLSKCKNCLNSYIRSYASIASPSLTFRYTDLKNGVLNVICDVHYIKRNIYDDDIFWLGYDVLETYSVEEINKQIDDYCTKRMMICIDKNQLELRKHIKRLHIERINLWPDTSENLNDSTFPEKLTLIISSEFNQKKILNKTEFDELLNKINALFSFCAKTIIVSKTCVTVKEHKDKLASDVAALLDMNNYTGQRLIDTPDFSSGTNASNQFDKVSLDGLTRKDLHEFTVVPVDEQIDLHKYLINNDIEKSIIFNEDALIWRSADIKIITTADYFEIEQVKEQLAIILSDSPITNFINKETGDKDFPKPKSGVIEYLLAAYEYGKAWRTSDTFIMSMDYVDGKYHNFYKTLVANNPNK